VSTKGSTDLSDSSLRPPLLRSHSEGLRPLKMPKSRDNNIEANLDRRYLNRRSISLSNRSRSGSPSLAIPRHPLIRKISTASSSTPFYPPCLSRQTSEKNTNRIKRVSRTQLPTMVDRRYTDSSVSPSYCTQLPTMVQYQNHVERRYTDSSVTPSYPYKPLFKSTCRLSTASSRLNLPSGNLVNLSSMERSVENDNSIDMVNNSRLFRSRERNRPSKERVPFPNENRNPSNIKKSHKMINLTNVNYKDPERNMLHYFIRAA
jgi:hypothetical protein